MGFKRLNNKVSHLLLTGGLFMTMFLSGCAAMNGDFNCDRVGGINGCVSMDEVYEMSENGTITADKSPYSVDGKQYVGSNANNSMKLANNEGSDSDASYTKTTEQTDQIEQTEQKAGLDLAVPSVGEPVRQGDRTQKIMLFDYVDAAGNYHEPSIVYTVLKQSHWVHHPVKAVKDMGDI